MKRLRIYVDTSVVGGCLDEEFAVESRALMEMVRRGEATLLASSVLADELAEAPPAVREVLHSIPDEHIEWIEIGEEEEALQEKYLENSVVTRNHSDDALHVAAATVARADVIASWNFEHIVNFFKIRGSMP
jgi:hypothetical protein